MTTWPTTPDGRWLVLRTCAADGTSHNGFRWPLEVGAVVTAPDWDPDPDRDCGGGLHGLLWGCGDAFLLSSATDAAWMVVAVDPAEVANPDVPDKVRFRSCEVVHVGDRKSATDFIVSSGGYGLPVVYAQVTAGDEGTATAGYGGTATAGTWGTATAGYRGTAIAGDEGTATAGDEGTATVGHGGTATAGYRGTATAGYGGTLIVKWWDGDRYRLTVGYVGEGGIEAGVTYRCDQRGALTRKEGES